MTASEIIQIIAALGTLVVVIGNVIVSIRNGQKADVISTHVNSMASAREVKIDALLETIATMTDDRARREKIAALLAQKQAGEVTVAVVETEEKKKT